MKRYPKKGFARRGRMSGRTKARHVTKAIRRVDRFTPLAHVRAATGQRPMCIDCGSCVEATLAHDPRRDAYTCALVRIPVRLARHEMEILRNEDGERVARGPTLVRIV